MKLFSYISNFLFPSRCIICDRVTEKDVHLCEDCTPLLMHPSSKKSRCPVCCLDIKECSCRANRYFSRSAVPFKGTQTARRSVYKLKFSARLDKVSPFAEYMNIALRERDILGSVDIITYIPMSERSQRKRGFNQAQLLAEELSELNGIPCEKLLYKYQNTSTQHSMTSSIGRSGNVLGIYEPLKEKTDLIKNKRILITDDILTTGNTLNEAAKTLLIFGAADVYCTAAVSTEKKSNKKPD